MYDESNTCIDTCNGYFVQMGSQRKCVDRCDTCLSEDGLYCVACSATETYLIDFPARQRHIVDKCDQKMLTYKRGQQSVCLNSSTDRDIGSASYLVQLFKDTQQCAAKCEEGRYEFIWACEITCNGFINGTHQQKCVSRECSAQDRFEFDNVSYCLTCGSGLFKTVSKNEDGTLKFECVAQKKYTNEYGWTFDRSCYDVSLWCEGHSCLNKPFMEQIYELEDGENLKCVSWETCRDERYPFVDDITHNCAHDCGHYALKYEDESVYHCVEECDATSGKFKTYDPGLQVTVGASMSITITRQCVNCTEEDHYVHGN